MDAASRMLERNVRPEIDIFDTGRQRLSLWGPFEIREDWYRQAAEQKAVLDGGSPVPSPAGLTLDARGHLRWDTTGVAAGAYTVRVTATDPLGAADTDDFVVNVS